MGAAIFDVAGLVLLALALAWLAVVTKACMAVVNDARELLGATPVPAERMRRGALRYPLIALLGATVLAAFGVLLLRGGLVSMVVWFACAAAVSLRPLLRITQAIPRERSP